MIVGPMWFRSVENVGVYHIPALSGFIKICVGNLKIFQKHIRPTNSEMIEIVSYPAKIHG